MCERRFFLGFWHFFFLAEEALWCFFLCFLHFFFLAEVTGAWPVGGLGGFGPRTLAAFTTSWAAADIGSRESSCGLAATETTFPLVAIALRSSVHLARRVAPGATSGVVLSVVVKVGTPASSGLSGTRMDPSDVERASSGPGMKAWYPPD